MKSILSFVFILSLSFARADSPLTSTHFSNAYQEEKMVLYAQEHDLDKKLLKFLGKEKKSAVIKIAIINAFGWGKKDLVHQYETYLLKKRKGLKQEVFDFLRIDADDLPEENEQTKLLSADDLMCWAYLQAIGDYFKPSVASRAAYFAYVRKPKSMAHATVFTLIACQIAFDSDWCRVYELGKEFLVDKTYEENILKKEAVQIIMDYLGLYKGSCK